MKPRLFDYPCGIHRGPMPVPKPGECVHCARCLAEEKARPPIPGYGAGTREQVTRERFRKSGRENGAKNVAKGNKIGFPQARVKTSQNRLLEILRSNQDKLKGTT